MAYLSTYCSTNAIKSREWLRNCLEIDIAIAQAFVRIYPNAVNPRVMAFVAISRGTGQFMNDLSPLSSFLAPVFCLI
jgi:hypothetical protein